MASVVGLFRDLHERVEIVETLSTLRMRVRAARARGARVGFVPTMGYLHDGHVELMHCARQDCDFVVTSIFVNPTQFGAGEDLATYPRDLDGDVARAAVAGVDLVFAPSVAEMYPQGAPEQSTWVTVDSLTDGLCGRSRPGHFRGVATVVSKLFNMVSPDVAYFGEKDYQQLAVIRRMVRDLAYGVEIVGVPTVREADGLAMSSRNAYLAPAARLDALCVVRALRAARASYGDGERSSEALLAAAHRELRSVPSARPQYVELVHGDTLAPLTGAVGDECVMALAVHIDGTRLIDNARLAGPRI